MYVYYVQKGLSRIFNKNKKIIAYHCLFVHILENEQDHDELCEQIRNADVVCLVFSVVDDISRQNIRDKWMPLLRECQINNDIFHPVILVGNKSDLINTISMHVSDSLSMFSYICLPLMNIFFNLSYYFTAR